MKSFRAFRRTLSWQIGMPLVLVTLALSLVGTALFYLTIKQGLKKQLHEAAEIAAQSVQYAAESSNRQNSVQRFVSALGAEDNILHVHVVGDFPARILASTQRRNIGLELGRMKDQDIQAHIQAVLTNRKAQGFFHGQAETSYIYILPTLISNLQDTNQALSRGVVYIEISTFNYHRTLNEFSLRVNSVFILLLVSLAVVLVVIINHRLVRPQLAISEVLRRRLLGEKAFIKNNHKNELGTMIHGFNQIFEHNDELDTLKGQFVSTVSHELRTPLTSIRGALGILKMQIEKNADNQTQTLVNIAERNATKLSALINDLLDLEKLSTDNLQLNFEVCDLGTLARESVTALSEYARQHQVRLETHWHLAEAPVTADAHRIEQVFANLISNAVKFSAAGQSVVITLIERDRSYRVSVIDKGRGIPSEFRDRIFHRFSQVDSSDSREKGGTGLGLSIVKLIIDKHLGQVDFESELGKGSTFYFDLPKRKYFQHPFT